MALLSRARVFAERVYPDACCPDCLLELAMDFSADTTAIEEARRDLPTLWSACAFAQSFSSMDASEIQSDLRTLRAKVRRARAACATHSASSSSTDVLHDFINAVCACLHFCLSLGESCAVQRAANRKRVFENRAGRWPESRTALFPFGEEFGVPSVLYWCKTLGTPYPLLLLEDMLRVAHPLVSFEIKESPAELQAQFLVAIVRRLGEYTKWASRFILDPRSAEDRALPPPVPTQYLKENMHAAVTLLASIRNSPDASPNALLILTEGFHEPLLGALFTALVGLERSDDDDADFLCRLVASLCGTLYHYVPARATVTPLNICPGILKYVAKYEQWSIYRVLHRALSITARNRRRCSGPDCTTVAHQDDWEGDSHFLACGRCQLMRYCGKDCQSKDWKRGSQVPHKLVCPLITRMMAVANVDMKAGEFEAAVKGLDWQTDDLRHLSLFVLNPDRLPGEIMVRAAEIHRTLMAGERLSDASVEALDNADLIRRIFDAKKAGIPSEEIADALALRP